MVLLVSQIGIILISIAIFLITILSLVALLLYARAKLTPQGEVTLQVNDKELIVSPGNTLLSTLSTQNIFLPSACGGGGTCAMCKAQVLEGGGSILQTEKGFFTRKEQQDNWRLGCQVKVWSGFPKEKVWIFYLAAMFRSMYRKLRWTSRISKLKSNSGMNGISLNYGI